MGKIFKELAKHWKACLMVFLLLLVQAWCDLSLPGYTSDIVDVGITQSGIESAVFDTVQENTLKSLELMMTEENADFTESCYSEPDSDGIRTLTEVDAESREKLSDILTMPEVILYMAASQNANGVDITGLMSEGLSSDSFSSGSATSSSTSTAVSPSEDDLNTVTEYLAQLPAAMTAAANISGSASAGTSGATEEMMTSQIREQMVSMIDTLTGSLDETVLSSLESRSIQLVLLDYKAQGIASSVQTGYLIRVGARMLGFTLLMVLVSVLIGLISSRVGAGIGRDLRKSVFTRVVEFSAAETDKFSTASLITRTTNDIQQVQMVAVMMLRMVLYAPILATGGIIKVAQSGARLTWIIVVAVCVLIGIILTLLVAAMPKFKIMQQLVDRLNLVSREILTGIMPIRAFSREKHEEERFDKANTDLMKTQLFTNRVMAFMMPAMTLIMNGLSLAIVWFGGKQIDAGTMQTGEMIAFITYSMQIVMSFLMLTMLSILLPRAGVAADRIDEVLRTRSTVLDAKNTKSPTEKKGLVCFDHVNFRYPGGEADALHDIDFTAEPGKTTAIIGSTGCGKSTLLNLIPRFYDVTGGSLTIDGVDVRDMKQSELRELLGYVPQKGILFSGTIASNLKFAGEQITDEEMTKAARIAQATEFIEQKNDTYESHIAQGGTNVSGGQKQRLSIARAIAKNPKIYLFDDSFSALDYKTDVILRRALKEETDNATVIIVAQRISTVLHADQILVLDEGRIVGKGTHEELMRTCPEYQDIARSQLSEKDLQKTSQKLQQPAETASQQPAETASQQPAETASQQPAETAPQQPAEKTPQNHAGKGGDQ